MVPINQVIVARDETMTGVKSPTPVATVKTMLMRSDQRPERAHPEVPARQIDRHLHLRSRSMPMKLMPRFAPASESLGVISMIARQSAASWPRRASYGTRVRRTSSGV